MDTFCLRCIIVYLIGITLFYWLMIATAEDAPADGSDWRGEDHGKSTD